jgi:hypothetical protein
MDFFGHFPILLTDDCFLFGPAIGAGASVRLTRLRSRMDLDFFHFLAPIN